MKQIAETDAAKAAEYGKESIKGGLDNNHIELLKKIYAKDADKRNRIWRGDPEPAQDGSIRR